MNWFRRKEKPWVVSKLMSVDKQTIYTVRDRDGDERQIQHPRTGEWNPVSKVMFSSWACYEEYHRERFMTAVPYRKDGIK